MILKDLYRVMGSYQEVEVVNDEREKVLFKGYLVDIMKENKELLDLEVTFIECDNDKVYIDLDV